jgi:Ca-activated chloride channel family protein
VNPFGWSFAAPYRLWLLVAVALLGLGYLWQQRRRAAYEQRLADQALLAGVLPRRPGWRRHLPASLMVLALAAMTVGFSRPSADVQVPRGTATIVVALDTSGSMRATDVSPSRLEAAKVAAEQFVRGLPDTFTVGLVSFSTNATIVAAPTLDHQLVVNAISDLELGGGTAIGDAVAASVQSAAGVAAASASASPAPVHIVLLSDGTNTAGRSVADGVVGATAAGYPVSTIAYGTQEGTVTVGERQVRVPVDASTLAAIAEDTGGTAYEALSGDELEDVYDDIAEDVGTRTERREITGRLVALSLLTAFGASVASLVLFRVLT